MWIIIALILFYLLTPVLLIYLCKISNTLKRIEQIVLAYAVGLVAGNIGIFPTPMRRTFEITWWNKVFSA